VFARNIAILTREDYKVDKSLINTRSDLDYKIPSYKEMIEEMKEWIDCHSELYRY